MSSVEISSGAWLHSRSTLYQVKTIAGQGTFGTVAKCLRMSDMQTVAIKMMSYQDNNVFQAREEMNNLLKLSVLDSDKCNLVKWHKAFTYRGYCCLEFETLDRSLYDLMAERHFRPLPLKEIRPIALQLANACLHLKTVGMIHADLKLENVMLVNHAKEPFKLKVIDFGLASDTSAATVGSYIQTRPYRSPEIILGSPFTEAVDMWSIGCTIAYLYLGHLLYYGHSEYDMMRCIVDTQGQPPRGLLNQGSKTSRYFKKVYGQHGYTWTLKSPWEIFQETHYQPVDCRTKKFKSLDELLTTKELDSENSADKLAEIIDRMMFLDMLKGMLDLDPARRLTPQQVLDHPFVTMSHICGTACFSSYFQSCAEIMTVCETSEVSEAQQSPPNSHNQQQCINPRPCKSAQPESTNKARTKREADAEDGEISETSRSSKMAKLEHRNNNCQESHASKDPTNKVQSSSALKGHTVRDPRRFAYTRHPWRCPGTTGIKRKFGSDKDQGSQGSSNSSKVKQQFQRDVPAEEDNPEPESHGGSGPKRKRV